MDVITISTHILTPHPRNSEFFDDITGDKWDEFLESIKERGIIEPLLVTQDYVVVSGNQRLRAGKELGMTTVPCLIKEYESEDDILSDLIETNIRQRGDVGGSAQKIGRRVKELERIKGVRQGSAKKATTAFKEEDIAEEFGMSVTQLKRYKAMADMIPELSEAVDAGMVTQGTALAMMKQLSEEEQLELISKLDAAKKYSQKEAEKYIDEIQALKNQPAKVIEKAPEDYSETKAKLSRAEQTINGMKADYSQVRGELQKRTTERDRLQDEINSLKDADPKEESKKHIIDTGLMFNARVNKFIEDVAGYIWLTDEILELPEADQKMFVRSVEKVQEWADQMKFNINQKMEGK